MANYSWFSQIDGLLWQVDCWDLGAIIFHLGEKLNSKFFRVRT